MFSSFLFQVPSSNGSQCHPVGLGRYVGPSAIPRKFPPILGTESHGRNSKEHNYTPAYMTTSPVRSHRPNQATTPACCTDCCSTNLQRIELQWNIGL